jgi:hypothetical protein
MVLVREEKLTDWIALEQKVHDEPAGGASGGDDDDGPQKEYVKPLFFLIQVSGNNADWQQEPW